MAAADPRLAKLLHVKFEAVGFPGIKNAVLIPDDIVVDAKVVNYIEKCLKLKAPNLLIEGTGGAVHPRQLLSEKQLHSPKFRSIIGSNLGGDPTNDGGKDDAAVSGHIREILTYKLKMITSAILQAMEETSSSTFHYSSMQTSYDVLCNSVLESGAVHVSAISAMHMNDEIICHEKAKDMIRKLFQASGTLTESSVTTQKVVNLDAQWLANAIDLRKGWEGHSCLNPDGSLKSEKDRLPASQFCFLGASTLLLFFRAKADDGKFDEKARVSAGHDPFPARHLLAPPGFVFVGGNSPITLGLFAKAFENAVPSVIINYTGAQSNVYAELIQSLANIIQGDLDELKQVGAEEKQSLIQGAGLLVAPARLALVDPSRLFDKALKAAYQDLNEQLITLPDVVKLLDLAKARPKVFTNTIKVVDPLVQSQEQCLEVLSEAISSTYTGVMSLGASSDDVTRVAWKIHRAFDTKAKDLQRIFKTMDFIGAFLTWCALVMACMLFEGETCSKLGEGDRTALCSLESQYPEWFSVALSILNVTVVIVPITGTLMTSLIAFFGSRQKWAISHMASEEIVSQIYQFRASVGPYSKSSTLSKEKNEDGEEFEDVSVAARERMLRHSFSKKIESIYVMVVGSELKNDFVSVDMENPVTSPVAETKSSYQSLLSSENDDGISALTGDAYYELRFNHLKKKYQSELPSCKRSYETFSVVILLGGALSSLLGAFKASSYIPVVVGFGAMLQHIMATQNWSGKLSAMNFALGGMMGTTVQWQSLSSMDKRSPQFKETMITNTEKQHMSVVQAITGMSNLFSGGTGQDEGSNSNEKGKEKSKGKRTEDEGKK